MSSQNSTTLALDAMGGDHAPEIVIEGASLALAQFPNLQFLIYGDEAKVLPLLDAHTQVKARSKFYHTPDAIAADEKPSVALRRGKNSSMRLAINAVKEGKADGAVSAGNTGALMATAKIVLRMLPGISRPAIASMMPNVHRDILMMDLGANLECRPRELVEFAVMGDALYRLMMNEPSPRVTLLNIGTEEMKGHDEIREAADMLRAMPTINFVGYSEGDDILCGDLDVIVTDGFSGNIALKTMEGTARFVKNSVGDVMRNSLLTKLSAVFAYPMLRGLKAKIDPRNYNGAMFLGLNGVVVKSHGGTDAQGFLHAIKEAHDMVRYGVNEKIVEELKEGGLMNGNGEAYGGTAKKEAGDAA